jgi:DNA-binding transcriptional MerR regulator
MAEYKIKDIEVLTGVKAHTIRIWEKRYGILVPERTESKIRTYSEEDLTHLLNISILNQNGLKISKIAELSPNEIKRKVQEVSFSQESESAVLSLLINSLIDYDEALFKRVLSSVILKEGVKSGYLNYVIPFLDRIGIMWLIGTIMPTQEHFISNLIRDLLILETQKLTVPESTAKTFVLFCGPGDWHEISLLFYNYLLREKGERTLYLGQNLPINGLAELADKMDVHAFVASLIAPLDEKNTSEFLSFVEQINTPVYVGGAQSIQLLKQNPNKTSMRDVKKLFM